MDIPKGEAEGFEGKSAHPIEGFYADGFRYWDVVRGEASIGWALFWF